MKNRFLSFLSKYWFCFLLSIIMVIGNSLSTYYTDFYIIKSDMIKFGLSSLYLIYVIPIYSLIYGCFSYMKIKKIWVPQLILYLITCIYFFGTNLIVDKEIDNWINILIFSVYPVVFSLIGAELTSLIYKMIKPIKENKNQKP